jgi:HK97 family phage prohead protease
MKLRPMPSEIRVVEGLELRDADTDGRYLIARACQFETPVDVGPFVETMDRGVFDATLSRHSDNIPMVIGHDDSVPPIARSVAWEKGDRELVGTFRFGTHEQARQALGLVEERMLTSVSVAFLPGKRDGDSVWTMLDGVPNVRRNNARLIHLGLVTAPADEDAAVLAVRSLGVPEEVVLSRPRMDEARAVLERLRAGRVS